MPSAVSSPLALWMGGASAPASGADSAVTSMLAPWIGGASAPAAISNPAITSMLAPWIGGASAPVATVTAAFTSLLAFWMGGASSPGTSPPGTSRNHLNLTLRQMLVDYYEKAFEKKKLEEAPVGKRKTLTLKKPDAKEAEIQERTVKVSQMLAKAEESLANKNDALVAQLVDSAIKSGRLVTNFDDFERERAARQKRRDDDDLLLYSTIL